MDSTKTIIYCTKTFYLHLQSSSVVCKKKNRWSIIFCDRKISSLVRFVVTIKGFVGSTKYFFWFDKKICWDTEISADPYDPYVRSTEELSSLNVKLCLRNKLSCYPKPKQIYLNDVIHRFRVKTVNIESDILLITVGFNLLKIGGKLITYGRVLFRTLFHESLINPLPHELFFSVTLWSDRVVYRLIVATLIGNIFRWSLFILK